LNPKPKDDLIPALYDSDYFTSPSSIGFDNYFLDATRLRMLRSSRIRLLVLRKAGIKSFGKMLEIGCGTGEFCHVVNNMGVSVTGIDISESVITEARSRYKTIRFRVGTILDVDPEVTYGALFAFQVIEHLPNPDGFFDRASRLLEKDGFLCVTTPSFECAECVGYENWIGFSTSFEHLHYFSSATIGKYAAKHGMHVAATLYGEGKGLDGSKRKEGKSRLLVKCLLRSSHLLSALKMIRSNMLLTKHDYQSKEPRHNLFMVLRKGQ
jgi:cyclopropane fatty-acyl-phospholipid synthase-like methyltransferase